MLRLDLYLVEQGKYLSRAKAQEAIKAGQVLVGGKEAKASMLVDENSQIEILQTEHYVSRGAKKLLHAAECFDFTFKDKVVVDIGASTGGFTQVALEYGASKVYSVDVGQGELAQILRDDPRVVNLENHDFRALTNDDLKGVNLVVSDVSFISLRHILPKINEILGKTEGILLFKPQFECGKDYARKYKGVVLDKKLHQSLLKDFITYAQGLGFTICNLTPSPIHGKEGNIEYLFHLNGTTQAQINVEETVSIAFNKK